MDRSTVVGIFEERAGAESAITELHRAGFAADAIGYTTRGLQEPGTVEEQIEAAPTAGEGAATGALTGAVAGGVLGAAAALLVPGIGPIVAGGLLAGLLAGAATGAALGGVAGALVALGIPEEEAAHYEAAVREGRVLVTVHADGRAGEAREILRRHGAHGLEAEAAGGNVYDTAPVRRTASDRPGAAVETDAAPWVAPMPLEGADKMPLVAMAAPPWEEYLPSYRERWERRYGQSGGRWEEAEPRYRYGWELRRQPEHQGREWPDVEPAARHGWQEQYPEHPWEHAHEHVRDAWDHEHEPTRQRP